MIRLMHARHGRNASLHFLSAVNESTEDAEQVQLHFLAPELYKTSALQMRFDKHDWSDYLYLLVFGRRDYDVQSDGDPADWMQDTEIVPVDDLDVWEYQLTFTDSFNYVMLATNPTRCT